MSYRRHGDYRGLHFSSETRRAMEQGEGEQASQARRQERLERKMEARRRKLEGHESDVTNPPMEAIGPQQVIETPQSLAARFWRFLESFRGPERF